MQLLSYSSTRLLKVKIPILFLLILILSPAIAQKKISLADYTISLKYHYGFLIQTSAIEVGQLVNQHPSSLELEVLKNPTGKNLHERLYKYAPVGASLQYLIFDPSKPLGNALCFYPHMNFRIFETPKNRLYIRLGYGAAFVEKRFNYLDNYQNDMISSRFNFTFSGRINYYFKIKNLNLNTGIGVLHISNGVIKVPDQGLNYVSLHLGFGISGKPSPRIYDSIPEFKKKNTLFVSWAGGVNQTYPVNTKDYFQSTLSVYAGRRLSHKSTINAGIDLFYDGMTKFNYADSGYSLPQKFKTFKNSYYYKAGFVVGHELSYHRLGLLTQLGVYLYNPFKLDPPIYQRYGVKYYITEKLFVMSALKIHYGSADFVEWTIGLRL